MPGPYPRLVWLMLLLALAWLGYQHWARPRAVKAAEATLRLVIAEAMTDPWIARGMLSAMDPDDRQLHQYAKDKAGIWGVARKGQRVATALAAMSDEELFEVWQAVLRLGASGGTGRHFPGLIKRLSESLGTRVALRDRLLRDLIDPALAQPPGRFQERLILVALATELASQSPRLRELEGQLLLQLLPLQRTNEAYELALSVLADRLRVENWPTLRLPWPGGAFKQDLGRFYWSITANPWLEVAEQWVRDLPAYHLAERADAHRLHDALMAGPNATVDQAFWQLLGGYSLDDKAHWLACQQLRAELAALPATPTAGEEVTRYRLLQRWLALLSQMMPNYPSQARQWLAAHPAPQTLSYAQALELQRHLPEADPELPRLQRLLAAGNPALADPVAQLELRHPGTQEAWRYLHEHLARPADTDLTPSDCEKLNFALRRISPATATGEQAAILAAVPGLLRDTLRDPTSWTWLEWPHFPAAWLAAITPTQLGGPLSFIGYPQVYNDWRRAAGEILDAGLFQTILSRGPPALRAKTAEALRQMILNDENGRPATLVGAILSDAFPDEPGWRRAYRQRWFDTWSQLPYNQELVSMSLVRCWPAMKAPWQAELTYLYFAEACRRSRPDLAPLLAQCDRYLGEVWPAADWASARDQAREAILQSADPLLWVTLAMALAPAWALNEPLAAARQAGPHWPARPGAPEELWLAGALLHHWHPAALAKLGESRRFRIRVKANSEYGGFFPGIRMTPVTLHDPQYWPEQVFLQTYCHHLAAPGSQWATASLLAWADRVIPSGQGDTDFLPYLPAHTIHVAELLALALAEDPPTYRGTPLTYEQSLAWQVLGMNFMPGEFEAGKFVFDTARHRWRLLDRLCQEGYELPAASNNP